MVYSLSGLGCFEIEDNDLSLSKTLYRGLQPVGVGSTNIQGSRGSQLGKYQIEQVTWLVDDSDDGVNMADEDKGSEDVSGTFLFLFF